MTADYYINNILEKAVKPVLHRKNVNETTDERKLFSSNRQAHAAKATQACCKKKKKNRPNFIEKTYWPPNFPDINLVENLWSLMDEVVYKDPTPKTIGSEQAWKKIPLSTLHDLSLHDLTASERDSRILTFRIYVLS